MNAFRFLSACAALAAAATAFAQSALPMIDAEVRKVDIDAGKITLRHGDITNLDMPAMTMVFRVKDPALLQKVKPG
ncbi:MAG: copper-binding protein, partial [Pseudomonadota bacterium]